MGCFLMRGSWSLWIRLLCQAGILLVMACIIAAYFYGLLDPQWSDVLPRR